MLVIDLASPSATAVAKWFLWESFFNVFRLHAACVMRHAGSGGGHTAGFAVDLNYLASVRVLVCLQVDSRA